MHKEPKQPGKKAFYFKTGEGKTLVQCSAEGEEHEMPFRDGKKILK